MAKLQAIKGLQIHTIGEGDRQQIEVYANLGRESVKERFEQIERDLRECRRIINDQLGADSAVDAMEGGDDEIPL